MTLSNLSSSNLRQSFQSAMVGGTTGTPNTGSISADSNGFTWSYWRWTATGSVTISTAGYADLLVVGAGGGGTTTTAPANLGGGGGAVRWGVFWLPVGTYTVTVAAATAAGGSGGTSSFGSILLSGGGRGSYTDGGTNWAVTPTGGGGGQSGIAYTSHAVSRNGAGVGGSIYGANDSAGITLNYAGSSVEYGFGGRATGAVTANTGGGGLGANGGASGVVIMKIRTN